jgi:glycosyltransferase involved in cell wall biosynthesis
MLDNKTIGVVVPAYNEERKIGEVISSIPDFVDRIVVIDDGSTDRTAEEAARFQLDARFAERVFVVRRDDNQGVGRAIADGYKWMAERNIDVIAVMAGDGQMDPRDLVRIINPIVGGLADYVKGNRLLTENSWRKIPLKRFIGNAVLSLLTKIASGYWGVIDSQSGYTAISARALKALDLDRIYRGYGVPNDILAKLNIAGFRMAQVPMEPVYYVGEKSKMKVRRVVLPLSFLLLKLFFYRLFYKYLVRDFHPIFLFYLAGIACFLFGVMGGAAVLFLEAAPRLGMAVEIDVSYGWMLLFSVVLLSGINFLLFAMWMDVSENRDLQINLLPDSRYDESRGA